MKTLGILGGMSWESTTVYYRLFNQGVRARLGGQHSAKLLLASVDFADIVAYQQAGDWQAAGDHLAQLAAGLEHAGADAILIATNTMHKVADQIARAVSVPLLHIGDVVADALLAAGVRRAGLLGTRYTMEQPFLIEHLRQRGLEVVTPDAPARDQVHQIIFDELCQGVVRDVSRETYQQVITQLAGAGAEAVILGCTEIGLLLGPDDACLPLYDTAALHVQAGLAFALG
ncbi:aspartate/glutamate racemase [Aquaspirillum sp. LM1]|uniref:aspartate/glutamate racemase family protein n=1 Tax=Aquaspirillum sp. LM1 TaxID=1938604 RepID=UPI000983BF5F|nr:aspartate/glutamate racemase family protein [Aquaspirillum sp. LM1]AQR66307.1 aspartate/glutamate racemase [Aquaspirillum sp. LM1]